jgi:hypothetical protein
VSNTTKIFVFTDQRSDRLLHVRIRLKAVCSRKTWRPRSVRDCLTAWRASRRSARGSRTHARRRSTGLPHPRSRLHKLDQLPPSPPLHKAPTAESAPASGVLVAHQLSLAFPLLWRPATTTVHKQTTRMYMRRQRFIDITPLHASLPVQILIFLSSIQNQTFPNYSSCVSRSLRTNQVIFCAC